VEQQQQQPGGQHINSRWVKMREWRRVEQWESGVYGAQWQGGIIGVEMTGEQNEVRGSE